MHYKSSAQKKYNSVYKHLCRVGNTIAMPLNEYFNEKNLTYRKKTDISCFITFEFIVLHYQSSDHRFHFRPRDMVETKRHDIRNTSTRPNKHHHRPAGIEEY